MSISPLIATSGMPVQLIHTHDAHGAPCYFVLRGSQSKLTMLRAKMVGASLNLAEYGEVLASGYGHILPLSERQRLQRDHNVSFDA